MVLTALAVLVAALVATLVAGATRAVLRLRALQRCGTLFAAANTVNLSRVPVPAPPPQQRRMPVPGESSKPLAVVLLDRNASLASLAAALGVLGRRPQGLRLLLVARDNGQPMETLPAIGVAVTSPHSFASMTKTHPAGGDVTVVPDLADLPSAPIHPRLLQFARTSSIGGSVTLGLASGGAEVLARCGLLDQRRATAHEADIERLREQYPVTSWISGLPLITEGGEMITTSSTAACVDGALAVLETQLGRAEAAAVAKELGHASWRSAAHVGTGTSGAPTPPGRLAWHEVVGVALELGFGRQRPVLGVLVEDGFDELAVAGLVAVLAPFFPVRLVGRQGFNPVRSRHGLVCLPSAALSQGFAVCRVLFSTSAEAKGLEQWCQQAGAVHVDYARVPPAQVPGKALAWLAANAPPALATWVARRHGFGLDAVLRGTPAANLSIRGGAWAVCAGFTLLFAALAQLL